MDNLQITFPELHKKFTLDILKQCVELAEGFEIIECENNYFSISVNGSEYGNIITDEIIFPLLLHRAVEGLNKKDQDKNSEIHHCIDIRSHFIGRFDLEGWVKDYCFSNYQPCHFTACEMAIMDCLCEVLG